MTIYTKKGDRCHTTLPDGNAVVKFDMRVQAFGEVDELVSLLGLLVSLIDDCYYKQVVVRIQEELFFLGASLPGNSSQSTFSNRHVQELELEIDKIDSSLPPLNAFILPGGCRAAALCQVCRTVCRRVERTIVELSTKYTVTPPVLQYLNRLSDFLFILSRKLNIISDSPEKRLHISCK